MPSNTTYHPYTHSPSVLTEYLRHKLHSQQAKCLSRSPPVQVEQNVPLECNRSEQETIECQSTYDLIHACREALRSEQEIIK